jgi:hypothetical protein
MPSEMPRPVRDAEGGNLQSGVTEHIEQAKFTAVTLRAPCLLIL